MTDQESNHPEGTRKATAEDAEPLDPGIPLKELAELGSPTSADFIAEVQTRIKRRMVAGEMVRIPAHVMTTTVQQYISDLFDAFRELGSNNDTPSGPKV